MMTDKAQHKTPDDDTRPSISYVYRGTFDEYLSVAMDATRIGRRELSKKSGLHRMVIKQLLDGKREPKYEEICQIAKCFWMPASYWLKTKI